MSIDPMTPEGPIPIPQKPVASVVDRVPESGDKPPINDAVNFFDLLKEWILTAFKSDILTFFNGGKMDNDKKATISGFVTCGLAILATFGVVIPAEYATVLISVGVAVLSYFTNKKD